MKKILFCIGLSMFLLLQGCSAMMALSGSQNSDFKVITKGNSKSVIESQPIKAIFTETQRNGNTIVKYQYTIGKEPSLVRALVYILLDSMTLFISELFTMPAEKAHARTEKTIMVEYNPQGEAVRVF
ncbi:hypothetical protein [Fusobacterium hwasookii]|uniref:Lipoprotein n=1 Tax=Fusobacterium hwasookii ChDC F206 TaxID=1307443 RepID=A0AAC8WIQ2_9FUSO|nr:hypothetical protein [Fusobacterium hwasookii]ALQ34824.1 hypothetical protein RN92_02460 [Fusobacterium hwasookii ChDC F206]ALQ38710.1 hypothetical protein RN97_11180 [Fusobacterium hwasookii ChDC F300]QNE69112.1 hypothetical protein H5V38_03865 [Fusobacterium hwasookii]